MSQSKTPSPDEARETLLAELREIVVPDKKHRAIVREALVLIELDGAVRSELDARERSLGLMASERDEAVQTARSLAREVEALRRVADAAQAHVENEDRFWVVFQQGTDEQAYPIAHKADRSLNALKAALSALNTEEARDHE